MKRKDFKESLYDALDNEVDGISYDEKMTLVHSLLVDYEKDNEEKRDISNKGWKCTIEIPTTNSGITAANNFISHKYS